MASATTVPVGVQTNVSNATVAGWGFTECFSSKYSAATSSLLASELSGCSGDTLMIAARQTGSSVFTLLAAASYNFLSTFTTSGNTTANENGTEWYNRANYSFGFAGNGDSIDLYSCDRGSANAHLRLCWHTGGAGGYRAGATLRLNSSTAWEKVILSANVSPVPLPAAFPLLLVALGGLGFASRRRKTA